jgi:hypothetical protein
MHVYYYKLVVADAEDEDEPPDKSFCFVTNGTNMWGAFSVDMGHDRVEVDCVDLKYDQGINGIDRRMLGAPTIIEGAADFAIAVSSRVITAGSFTFHQCPTPFHFARIVGYLNSKEKEWKGEWNNDRAAEAKRWAHEHGNAEWTLRSVRETIEFYSGDGSSDEPVTPSSSGSGRGADLTARHQQDYLSRIRAATMSHPRAHASSELMYTFN